MVQGYRPSGLGFKASPKALRVQGQVGKSPTQRRLNRRDLATP